MESRDWKDINGSNLVELRSAGRQTLVAPSVHPSGDRYLCHCEAGLEAAEIGNGELREALNLLATTALAACNLPAIRNGATGEGGSRHDYALALAGFLLRSGRMDERLALKILNVAWDAKGWPDEGSKREAHRDLEGIVRDTAECVASGRPVVGGPTLEGSAPGVVRLLCKWWGWDGMAPSEQEPEEKEDRRNQGDRLIGYALEALGCEGGALFVDQHGDPHALIDGSPVPLNSRCYSWLRRLIWEREQRALNGEYLKTASGTLAAQAEFSGEVKELHTRAAWH